MRRSLRKLLVGGCGLPVCYVLPVVPLKIFYMGQKDELVLELAPICVICPSSNFRIIGYPVTFFFSLSGKVIHLVLLVNLWEQKNKF